MLAAMMHTTAAVASDTVPLSGCKDSSTLALGERGVDRGPNVAAWLHMVAGVLASRSLAKNRPTSLLAIHGSRSSFTGAIF